MHGTIVTEMAKTFLLGTRFYD